MLAEIIYSFLFAIYAVVLIIWYSIYDEISFNTQRIPSQNSQKEPDV
jgi:hypothetical protein